MFLSPSRKIAIVSMVSIAVSALPAGSAFAYISPFDVFMDGPIVASPAPTTETSAVSVGTRDKTVHVHSAPIDKRTWHRN